MCWAQICHLEDLRALSLAGNHLRDLPRLLATYLRKLASLNLACNALQRIPPVLALMPSLRHLDMSGNVGLEVHPSVRLSAGAPGLSCMPAVPAVYALVSCAASDFARHPSRRRTQGITFPCCLSAQGWQDLSALQITKGHA